LVVDRDEGDRDDSFGADPEGTVCRLERRLRGQILDRMPDAEGLNSG